MARTNLEDRLFSGPQIQILADYMGWSRQAALGSIAYLWHNSQYIKKSECTSEEIQVFAEIFQKKSKKKLISGLILAEFIHELGNNKYLIHGNKKHIDKFAKLKANAKKGAEKRWNKDMPKGNAKPMPNGNKKDMPNGNEKGCANTNTNTNTDISPNGDVEIRTFDARSFLKLWNEICGRIHRVDRLTEGRRKKINTRLLHNRDSDYWRKVFEKIFESNFLTGDNASNWKISLDWIISNDTNHVKVLEGKYSDKSPSGKSNTEEWLATFDRKDEDE